MYANQALPGPFVVTLVMVLCLPAGLRGQEPPLFGESLVVLDYPDRVLKTTLTRDGLTLYFADLPRDNPGSPAIWEARRTERRGPFGTPTRLGSVINQEFFPWSPCVAPDDRFLYFSRGHLRGGRTAFSA